MSTTPLTAREALERAKTYIRSVGFKPADAMALVVEDIDEALAALSVQPAREALRRSELAECRQAIIDARSDDDDADVARSRERLLARIDAAISAAPAPVETGWQARAREALKTSDLRPWGWAPGSYTVRCMDCGPADRDQINCKLGDKRSSRCRPCAEKARDALAASLPPAPSTGEG